MYEIGNLASFFFCINPRPTKGFFVTRYHPPPSNFRNEPLYDVYFGTNG